MEKYCIVKQVINIAQQKGRTANSLYFEGKWVGYCNDANERDRYYVLMTMNGNDGARILAEYAGFSLELKNILTRIAVLQASRPKRR